MSKIRLKYDIIAQRAVDTESGVNIDEALRRRKVEIQNISNSLNQTNYEVQELGETVTSAAAIAASMEGRLSAVEDDVDDLTNEKMDKSSSADFYPRYSNPEGYLTSASMDRYATKEYVEENTSAFLTSADLSDYATEQWVEDQDYLTSADLDDYVTDQYLENALEPYATSAWVEENFQPSGDYATTEYVDSKTSAFITSAALDPYAEKTYVEEGLATKLDSSAMSAYAESAWVDQNFQRKDDYVTETKLETELTNTSAWAEATFASASQLSSYATTQDLEDGLAEKLDKSESANYYPTTNPSAFIDATYLNGYATEEYVQSQTSGLQPSGNYATQEWVGEQGYLTEVPSDYAQSAWVAANFASASQLSDYYLASNPDHFVTSGELSTVSSQIVSQIPSLEGYATSAWVEEQGYLTEIPSEYVTETEMGTAIESATSGKADKSEIPDVSDFVTQEDIDKATSGKMEKSQSADFYPMATNPSGYLTEHQDLTDYATKQYVTDNTSAFITSSYLDPYAKTSELAAVSAEIMNEMPSIEGLAQEDWVKANFASAAQLAEKLDKTASADFYPMVGNPSGFLTSDAVAQSDWTETDSADPAYIKNKPAALSMAAGEGIQIVESNNTITFSVSGDYAERSDLDDYYPTTNPSGFLTEVPAEYVTDTELQTVLDDYVTSAWVIDQLDEKVDKVPDMGLSHEDFTSAYKDKLDHIEDSANKNVQSDWTESDSASDAFIKNKPASISLKGIDGIEITESDNNLYVGVSGDFATNDDLNYVSAHIPSLSGYATERYVQEQTSGKVDKVAGKDLSTNDFTDALKDKLDAIEASAQVNVQSDWEEVDTTSDAYIKNKPAQLSMAAGEGIRIVESDNTITISVSASYAAASALDYVSAGVDYVSGALEDYATTQDLQDGLDEKVDKEAGKGLSTNDYDDAASAKLYGIQAGAEVNVQSDWTESDSASDAFIKNKPSPISMAAGNGISITEANDTVTIAVTDAIATSAWVASNFASAAQISDMATQTYVIQETSGKLDKSESANYWPQTSANAVIPAGTDASNQLVNELGLAAAMADFGGFKKSTPDASGKPTESDPSTKIIYLTYVSSAASPDKYNEWIWDSAGNDYELIGDTTLDLTGYATETYVDQHTSGKIDWASSGQFYLASNPDGFIDSTALEPYAQTTYVDAGLNKKFDTSAMSAYAESAWVAANFQSAGQFVTSAGFNEAIAEYYKKNETSGAAELTAEFAKYQLEGDYVTSAGLTEKLNETSAWANETFQPVGSYATTTDLDNTSAWAKATFASASQLDDYYPTTNPSGFLTNSDLTGLATETYVQTQTSGKLDKSSSGAFYLATNPDHFVTSGELATLSAKIESDIPSLDGYATEEWVGQQGYLTSVPSEYVTDTEMGTAIETATSGKMDKSTSAQFYPRSTNPENYVTSGELSTLSAKIEGDIPSIAGLAAETWVQANFASASQISDMATQTWVGQQDFATSVQIDEIEEKIPANATSQNKLVTRSDLDAATTGAFEVVSLGPNDQPDVAYPNGKTIYLTKDSSLQVTDPYTEWIWLSGTSAFEVIGETTIDLTDYATQNYVQSQTSGKVDKVTGMGLSHIDFTSAYQSKLDSIAPSAEVNVQSDWNVTNSALDSYIANKPDIIIPQVGAGVTDVPKYIMVVTAMPPAAQIDPNTIYLVQGTYIGT